MPDSSSSPTEGLPEKTAQSREKILRLVFSVSLTFIVLGVLGYLVYREKEILLTYDWQIRPGPLLLSFALYSVDLVIVAIIWGWIMNTVGIKISYIKHFRYYTVSNVAKRIPGTIWYIASRATLYNREGIDPKLTSLASGMELAISIMASVLVCSFFALTIIQHYNVSPMVLVLTFLIGGIIIHPRVMAWIFRLLKVEAAPFSYINNLLWLFTYAIAWILGGVLLFVIGNIITPIPIEHLAYVIGSYVLVSLLSTALFFSPSNLGISEVGLSLLLANIMPSSIAVVVAVLARITITLFEFLWAGLSVLIKPNDPNP